MTRCRRCAEPFEPRSERQVHCLRCAIEVAAIVAADTERRTRRVFAVAKDLTGAREPVL